MRFASRPDSLQDRYAPDSVCFGCGPANPFGLRIKSAVEGQVVVCDWQPRPEHHAFDNILNGGITGTLLDCHSNWTAISAFLDASGASSAPPTVTSEFQLRFIRPTPMKGPVRLTGKVLNLEVDKAVVESTLEAEGKTRATFVGTFMVVSEGHPAFHRWSPSRRAKSEDKRARASSFRESTSSPTFSARLDHE